MDRLREEERALAQELLELYDKVEERMGPVVSEGTWGDLLGTCAGAGLGAAAGRGLGGPLSTGSTVAWSVGGGAVGFLLSQILSDVATTAEGAPGEEAVPPEDAVRAFEKLRVLRNRLLHDFEGDRAVTRDDLTVLRAEVEPLNQWLDCLHLSGGIEEEEVEPEESFFNRIYQQFQDWVDAPAEGDSDKGGDIEDSGEALEPSTEDPPLSVTAETVLELVNRHDENVTRFALLLHERLSTEARDHLLKKLRLQRYVGDDIGVLCEFCLETNPDEILKEYFTVIDLTGIAVGLGCEVADDADSDALCRTVLGGLGFTPCDPLLGLRHVRGEVQRLHQEARLARSRETLTGCVHGLDMDMERLLHGLITFYGSVLWSTGFQDEIVRWDPAFGSGRLTLGARCNLLMKMEKEVGRDELRARRFSELFGGREEIVGREVLMHFSEIIPKRAKFAHFRDEMDGEKDQTVRARALEIFEGCEAFLGHLHGGRIYPRLVMVADRVRDRFGRSYVTCRSDDGTTERVFTHQELEPNKRYFLYPRTNPVRIFPVIIPYQEAG